VNIDPGAAIAEADHSQAETQYRLQLAREMAAAAYEQGQVDGYLRAVADVKAYQHGLVLDAELEARRWGPGGRAHFADPRPGDFPGRGTEALTRLYRTEPRKEAQAG
jgi:hypothetical protein